MPRRDSARVQKPRLAGRETLSLDAVEKPMVESHLEVHWDEILFHLNCDADERALFHACKLGRIPRNRAGATLGWAQGRVEAVRRRLDRKLAAASASDIAVGVRDGGTSLRPYFHGFGPGRYTYALSHLDSVFLEEINRIRRKNISWSECSRPKSYLLGGSIECFHSANPGSGSAAHLPGTFWITSNVTRRLELKLEQELEAARIQLELAKQRRAAKREIHEKYRKRADEACAAVSLEMDSAVLHDREPSSKTLSALTAANAKVEESSQMIAAADRAVEKAQAAVQSAQDAIHRVAYETFTKAIAGPAESLHRALYTFVGEVLEFDRKVDAARELAPTLDFDLTQFLFDHPRSNSTDGFGERMAKWGIIGAVSTLLRLESGYEHGSPARRRYETRGGR